MAKKNLVIVESPAKAKTIGKYLGRDYEVRACMGHLRDLPKSKIGIDFENGFEPDYRPIRGKEELIRELKELAAASDTVYLATDPDREGEAISWHLQFLLGLPASKVKRVTFNEITKNVVQASIQTPRAIDQALVDAQQARRLLDRIVGYQLSPLLWRKVRRGLSAGRVQSVATRMVDEREREISAFTPEEYWTLDAMLADGAGNPPFAAHYHGKNGKKVELHSSSEVEAIMQELDGEMFRVESVKQIDKQRSPSPPFTTSTMQQDASRKLNMTPRRTMAIAQQLYEGVDIAGEGTVGLITYMRTDSLRISDEALSAAKSFIKGRYGESYYPPTTRRFKAKANAQDAHEAIRPSNVNLTPEQVKQDLTGEQYRLYRLIWSRFLASQMANAVYDSVSAEITAGAHMFHASASNLKFAGYLAVYEESHDDEKEEKASTLPPLAQGQSLKRKKFVPEQHFTQPPPHYTDATLIRAMEQNGVGRPSTYAPTVSTIIDREYVIKEGKHLRITPLGTVVTGLMEDKFPDIVDTKFTANMEKELDSVEEGKIEWKGVLGGFYDGFSQQLSKAEEELEGIHLKIPDEESEEKCDLCGRNMVIKSGRFGRFLACPGYPDCKFTKPLVVEMPGRCPQCGLRILKKTSRKGYTYYGCEKNPTCEFMTWDVPLQEDCPFCGQTMFKKSGRGAQKKFCINPNCSHFVPEDQRGYKRKPKAVASADGAEGGEEAADSAAVKKTRKTSAKKTTKAATAKSTTKKTSKAASEKSTTKKTSKAATAKSTTKKTTKAASEKSATKKTTKAAAAKSTTKKTTARSRKSTKEEENG